MVGVTVMFVLQEWKLLWDRSNNKPKILVDMGVLGVSNDATTAGICREVISIYELLCQQMAMVGVTVVFIQEHL